MHDSFFSALHRFNHSVCRRVLIVRWGWCVLSFFAAACGIDKLGITPALPPEQVLARVRFEAPVYNLATATPYNTVQLRATGYSGTGQAIDAPIEFSVAPAAETKLSVDSIGMLRAIADGKKLLILARMRYNGTTRTDSAFVYVIAGTPSQQGAHVSFKYAPQDSAKIASGMTMIDRVALLRSDSFGDNFPSVVVKVWSADSSIAKISSGFDVFGDDETNSYVRVQGDRPGQTMLYASAYAYGTFVKDSTSIRVGWKLQENLSLNRVYLPRSLTQVVDFSRKRFTIGVGGCVIWQNRLDVEVDITFDDPSTVGPPTTVSPGCKNPLMTDLNGGNIAPFTIKYDANGRVIAQSQNRSRTFPKPGIYTYRSTLWGSTGTIVVCDEKNDPTCGPENSEWLAPAP